MVISILLSIEARYHYHGLLQFGPAPVNAWYFFVGEHLIVWLIPALLFWIGGVILSKSRIRPIDVFGTVVFAQLPLIGGNLLAFTPSMRRLAVVALTPRGNIAGIVVPMYDILVSLIVFVFVVWMLIWMFNALKVSCNLKGAKLGILYAVAIIGGDILCRLIINFCYR